jgi:Major Facilitator Superfamily
MSAPAQPAQHAPTRPVRRGPVLIALMTAMALAAMDNTIVATAIPQVVRDIGGFSLFSWVFSSYLLTQTVTIPVQGRLADQWGRKPVLIAGTIIFLAGSALCASSWSMVSLIAFRGLQGIGAGGVQATVNTLAGDLYDLAAGARPGRGQLPEGGHRHRNQPRVRRADRGGRADHRRGAAAHAPALRRPGRRHRVHRPRGGREPWKTR